MVKQIVAIVVVVLFLRCGWIYASIPRVEYTYEAEVLAKPFGNSEIISNFGVIGNIALDIHDNKIVAKFNDLKTNAYNGLERGTENSHTENLDASPLYKPFVIYYEGNSVSGLGHQPDDPAWSVNMKKAIGSILQFEWSKLTENSQNFTEWNIYGKCKVNYKTKESDNVVIVEKRLNECEEETEVIWGNLLVDADSSDQQRALTRNVARLYTIIKNEERAKSLLHIESVANIIARNMPKDRHIHHIFQKQILNYLNYSEVDTPFDHENVVVSNITIKYSPGAISNEKNASQLVEDLLTNLEQYEENFKSKHLKHLNFKSGLVTEKIANTLLDISKISPAKFSKLLESYLESQQFSHLFTSLLPYIGTEQSLNYMKKVIENKKFNKEAIVKILANFPNHIKIWNEKLPEKLEYLINLDEDDNKLIKYTGILNFATALTDCYNKNECSKEVLMKYANMYKKLWIDAKEYDYRMMYMLGLSNMAAVLDADYIIPLITNSHEYLQIRSLAIYAFKYALVSEHDKVFSAMWPAVCNQSEQLSVRVAALDLTLNTNLTDEQLDTVIRTLSKYWSEEKEQHIYHYFYTSIAHLRNRTQYSSHKFKMPQTRRALTTGNYKYRRDDYSIDYKIQMIADPNTNYVETVLFTIKQHALTVTLRKYTVYLKMEGIFDSWFEKFFTDKFSAEMAIPELLKIIQKNNFQLKSFANIHVDVVLFCDDRAYLATHLEGNHLLVLMKNLLEYIQTQEGITIPFWHNTVVTSDLGIKIDFTNQVSQFFYVNYDSHKFYSNTTTTSEIQLRYERTSHVTLICNNPLNNIDIGSIEVRSIKVQTVVPFITDTTEKIIKWQNDNITLHGIVDIKVATVAEEESTLKMYCPKCASYYSFAPQFTESNKLPLKVFDLMFHHDEEYAINEAADFNNITGTSTATTINLAMLKLSIKLAPFYKELTESSLQFVVHNMIHRRKAFSRGSEFDGSIAYTIRKISDGSILRRWNLKTSLQCRPRRVGEKKLENNLSILFDSTDNNGKQTKVCFDSKLSYHVPRPQMYSLIPSKPSEAKFTLAMGTTNCSSEHLIEELSVLLSVTEEQKEFVLTLPEYDDCLKQSTGLKFTPPTKECIKISYIISQYRRYDFNFAMEVKTEENESFNPLLKLVLDKLHGILSENTSKSHTFGIDDKNLTITEKSGKNFVDSDVMELFLVDSVDRWFYEEYVKWGLQSNCLITPNTLKTFTGTEIKIFADKVNGDMIAFMECMKTIRRGLVFTRLDDQYLALKFWSEDSVLDASRSNNTLQVTLDGKLLQADDIVENHSLRAYMLGSEAIYFDDNLISVYYNTEYLMIRIYSNYNNYICGLCSR